MNRQLTKEDMQIAKSASHSVLSSSCNPMDCSLSASSVHRISEARILERAATPFSRGSFPSRDWTQVSSTVGGFLTTSATREAHRWQWKWYLLSSVAESNCLRPHAIQSMGFSSKNTGVGSHSLLQGFSQPRDQTQVSCTAGRFFTDWATVNMKQCSTLYVIRKFQIKTTMNYHYNTC